MKKKLLIFDRVSKHFYSKDEDLLVIDNISFEVKEKEIISILGPSGCGKSTILNLISHLIKPTSGNIIINSKINYMFQKDNLLPWRNIISNITLGLEIKHQLTKENLTYVDELLKKYDLDKFKKYYPSSLSGGMRQRVSLIRTLSLKPDLLLLDEPFSQLDSQGRFFVQNDVYNILKKEEKSSLIVTHDIAEAILLSSKIIILSKRPCKIKKIIDIEFDDISLREKRKHPLFSKYYEEIFSLLNEI